MFLKKTGQLTSEFQSEISDKKIKNTSSTSSGKHFLNCILYKLTKNTNI